ncbi:MAG: 4-deoxy-4-formamido-L-arabinose-phosphoundecaprenol deformylase [Nitrospirae bacterium]|nr:4-deoxy-4-formamido-L-arabinose-phosphoundecaprenol deformylase [Nitrospirota bacterium]
MDGPLLAIKVDVDTDRGTRIGVPNLAGLFRALGVRATFLFSLGPDTTGRAIRRLFRPGFFGKVRRTRALGVYGLRTLLNGTLLPAPHIGRRNEAVMRRVRAEGHEVGIHCYDHTRWQDDLGGMTAAEVAAEFDKARREFERVFREPARTAGAAGWQANRASLAAYDDAGLLYASDARGTHPFYPRVEGVVYKTLQIPTTLPTLDELLGRPEYPEERLGEHYLSLLDPRAPNVMTVHAEIEGMGKLVFFQSFLDRALARSVRVTRLCDLATALLDRPENIPIRDLGVGAVDGRSGSLAVQLPPSHR